VLDVPFGLRLQDLGSDEPRAAQGPVQLIEVQLIEGEARDPVAGM
jgi:hypothetical protein